MEWSAEWLDRRGRDGLDVDPAIFPLDLSSPLAIQLAMMIIDSDTPQVVLSPVVAELAGVPCDVCQTRTSIVTLGAVDYCARCAPIWHPSFGPACSSPAALAAAAIHFVGCRWPADAGRIPPGHVARLGSRWSVAAWRVVAGSHDLELAGPDGLDVIREALAILEEHTPRAVLELVR